MENKDRDRVLEHFEKISNVFDRIYDKRQNYFLPKLIDILLRGAILQKRMKIVIKLCGDIKDKEILDIGSGPGRYAMELVKHNPKSILGIDISAQMINLANRIVSARGYEKICRFEKIDFLDKDFQEKFDIVIAIGIFDYTSNPDIFISKIYDITKEKAVFSFPIKWTFITPLRMAWLLKRNCPNFYYTKRGVKKLLKLCGFRIISIYRIGSFLVNGNYVVLCEHGGNK